MKLFLSWSGSPSDELAKALATWISSVIQSVEPFCSSNDIEKGTKWGNDLSSNLETCKVGIICVTADNMVAPWLLFEAGALSKSVSGSRVIPLLFGDLATTDLSGPLSQFQAASFNRDEMKKVVETLNEEVGRCDGHRLPDNVMASTFDMWWPILETKVNDIMSKSGPSKAKKRTERDMIEEVLSIVRNTNSILSTKRETFRFGSANDRESSLVSRAIASLGEDFWGANPDGRERRTLKPIRITSAESQSSQPPNRPYLETLVHAVETVGSEIPDKSADTKKEKQRN